MDHFREAMIDINLIDELIKEVFHNNVESVVLILNYIRAEHPQTFQRRHHYNNTALLASAETHVSPLIMRILLLPENRIYAGGINAHLLSGGTALHLCVKYDQKNDNIKKKRTQCVRPVC
jgi:hypothetical protein